MRDFIDIVEQQATTGTVLMEGPLADRVKATAQKVAAKYGDIKYGFLATATTKAMSLFQSGENNNPQAVAALQKIAKVGKVAYQNRALIAILAGMTATLVGMASNPAAASQAANNIDQTLTGDLDQIIDQLKQSGIDIGAEDNAAGLPQLPPDVSAHVQRAAKALHAIARFEYTEGVTIDSSREVFQHMSVEGEIVKSGTNYNQHMVTKTSSGLVLFELQVSYSYDSETGVVSNERMGGVKFELMNHLKGLDLKQVNAVQDYIDAATGSVPTRMFDDGATPGTSAGVETMLRNKAGDLAALIGTAVGAQQDGRYRIKADASGVKVGK